MSWFVLVAWLVQAVVGVLLLVRWARHRRPQAVRVLTHVGLSVAGLLLWVVHLASGSAVPAWIALVLITIGNAFGDNVLVARWRRGERSPLRGLAAYGATLRAVFRGRLPRPVLFHAVFAGVVYFSALAACIVASV